MSRENYVAGGGEGESFPRNRNRNSVEGDNGGWKHMKLTGGIKVPVWKDGGRGDRIDEKFTPPFTQTAPRVSSLTHQMHVPTFTSEIQKPVKTFRSSFDRFEFSNIVVNCPICFDPIIEAAANTCGHVYCYDCIEHWRKVRNWCPICQDSLTTTFTWSSNLHRVYCIDQLNEKYSAEFPQEMIDKLKARRAERLEFLRKERNSSGMIKSLSNKARGIRLYFQSKGFLRGIKRLFVMLWRGFWNFSLRSPSLFTLLMGMFLLGVICGLCLHSTTVYHWTADFLNYIWKYPAWPWKCKNSTDANGTLETDISVWNLTRWWHS